MDQVVAQALTLSWCPAQRPANFRLITRLLTQMERVARINQMPQLTPAVVETARMNLVIGQA